MNKRILGFIFAIFILGAVSGAVLNSPQASANFIQDLFNKYIPNLLTPKPNAGTDTTPAPTPTPAPAPGTTPAPVTIYAPTVDYEQAVIKAVDDSSKSVVSIIISKNVPIIEQCPYNPFSNLSPDLQNLFGGGIQYYQPCQKGTQLQKVGGGSGFIVSSDGLILTNKHVVADTAAEYTVITSNGKKYPAKVLARDPSQDLAVIKIEATDLTAAKIGNSDSIKLGQTAIAIGYSLGEFSNTVSVGVISGLARTITAAGSQFGTETLQGVIQTDAAINPGNSGGPLLNLKGEVIGINTAVASGAQSIGFAIPINRAKKDIKSVSSTGSIKVPYLGVRYVTIDADIAKSKKLAVTEGALINSDDANPAIVPNSPASKAGIMSGDIITRFGNTTVNADHQLGDIIQNYNIGDVVDVKILRGSETLNLKITLEERA
ncbi:MAG TPA: trypsin-like peptidase domain-containing protein [Candidatus Paceibacterota bacterium]|nr:trypsin-like peptidase domain-containing protein [Candidatus Paceibacterota bacterium]